MSTNNPKPENRSHVKTDKIGSGQYGNFLDQCAQFESQLDGWTKESQNWGMPDLQDGLNTLKNDLTNVMNTARQSGISPTRS